MVFRQFQVVHIDASFPAESMYLKRGYRLKTYEKSSIYRNVWSRPETAEHMAWKVTADEDGARERIQRTITWQKTHDAWLVYERGSGQAIGFAVRSRRQTSAVGKLMNWRFIKGI